ncbi:tRNA (pseudouridine(54)-N(1))-methyltransferase TrmY [Vibrio cholerae]|nr:tRNA (pseudouridine(54)-N(1))-methyltransferase TrmY [Vibrio cholerae]EGQ9898311.1 tRNA (pseudouridine(54)-N(1))-methyltransferase TrmY [Vibrio cholerae]EGR0073833.1 tRNA (pseudouridine(54)-N(1))-methyltransferase TrmY [Vibrio cholerae]EGR0567046.1 tRNA (pseudouridine(54)-N(1))-methyltransferase TrmY [Vibrio cholerae]
MRNTMRSFILRARSAPTDSQRLLDEIGGKCHTEILAHCMMNSLFTAQSHREDVVIHLVLESTRDYSRTITVEANEISDVGGFHEAAFIALLVKALDASVGMGKEQTRVVQPGLTVRTISFEALLGELAEHHSLYMMDKKGDSIRDIKIGPNPCFILTDHIPMPKKSGNSMKRLGVEKISLGPKMLFASQCVTLIHNEIDHQETGW